jgi:hypothetical protein
LEIEIAQFAEQLAPALLAVPGCGPLTAAKIIGETAGVDRFKSRDAYARYNGTAVGEQISTPTQPHWETVSSTQHCTGLRSPRPAGIRPPKP